MHSALFVAEIPEENWVTNAPAAHPIWSAFTDAITVRIAENTDVQRLAENVWLVDTTKAISSLAWLISIAENQKIAHRILSIAEPPVWLPVGSCPKTTPGHNVMA